ncbi:hypothetical protein Lser_V15G33670 [Lactuca serriola]
MMLPNEEESSKITIDDFGSSRLLHDIEEISKALYLHDPPKPSIDQTPRKSKYVNDNVLSNQKKSSIWKWKPLKALTHIRNHRLTSSFFLHVHSIEGLPINFNDLSLCVCWKRKHEVLKTRSIHVKEGFAGFEETLSHQCSIYIGKTDHDNVAKYEPKLSLLYVSVVGAPSLDLGKHWIDLTRLLPLTLMELEEEKNRNGKWKTSFKLMGKAKGAIINVSFGFSLSGNLGKIPDKGNENLGMIPYKGSENLGKIQDRGNGASYNGMLQRVKSIPSNSRRRTHASSLSFNMTSGPSISLLYELLDDPKPSSLIDYDEEFTFIDKGVEFAQKDQDNVEFVENSCIETIDVEELFAVDEDNDKVIGNLETETFLDENLEELELFLQNLSTESPELDFSFQKNPFLEDNSRSEIVRSRSLDDLTKTVVNDFMNFLGSDSEPESPRERLLRQFEKETQIVVKNFDFDLDVEEEERDTSNVFNSSFLFQEIDEVEVVGPRVGESLISRRKAKMLENLETEALMEEWGLNERAFQNSPRTNSGAFGSPVYCSPERLPELPPIGGGLGSFLKMGNGGFLRSMSPLVFRRAKNGERLIVQVSSSVVLPMAMGSNGLDIMRKWAAVGGEKMIIQAARLMPMEEITGRRLQELEMEVLERRHELLPELDLIYHEINSEYVSVDEIAPSAIEKIQHLLIEGLRIQSGIPTEEPPSSISVNLDSTSNPDIEELLAMSVSLDECLRSENHGHFSNFTLALRLLLRDPFRDYEPVGIPMFALIHVERDHTETTIKPVFKINEIHVTGFRVDLQKNQSGSRWLHSSGMNGKMKRRQFSKSNALVKSSIRSMNMKHEETLWSVSSYVHGEVSKWKELSGMSLYVRNPDIVFK